MRKFARAALALASAGMIAPAVVEAQAKPVVAVMYFDNNSVGKDRADYDGIGKGMAELMINDLLPNQNLRVVERERVQALLTEQNMTKSGAIDPQTAVRLGKIIGAQYMITGAFMSTPSGVVLTARTINVETSAIGNPTRINARGDDVLKMIADLNAKMIAEMQIPALRVGEAGGTGAQPAGQPAAAVASPAQMAEAKPAPAGESKPAAIAVSKERPAAHVAHAKSSRKMDMKAAMLYSKALEEEDAGNKSKAVELYKRLDVVFPDYAPVQQKIKKLSA